MATATDGRTLALSALTPLHWVGIALAFVSAAVHLLLGISLGASPLGFSFLFAAVGFLAGSGLVAVGYRRRLLYALGIPFTAGQIVLWYAMNRPAGAGDVSTIEGIDKLAQAALIVALVVLLARES